MAHKPNRSFIVIAQEKQAQIAEDFAIAKKVINKEPDVKATKKVLLILECAEKHAIAPDIVREHVFQKYKLPEKDRYPYGNIKAWIKTNLASLASALKGIKEDIQQDAVTQATLF